MNLEKLIKKTVIKFIVLVIVLATVLSFNAVCSTIIEQYLALGTLENSGLLFAVHELYNNWFKPITTFILIIVVLWFIGTNSYNFIKYFKNKENTNEKN